MKYLLILFVVLGLFVFGCVSGESPSAGNSMVKPSDSMAKPTDSMQKNNSSMQKSAMANDSGTVQKTNDSMTKPTTSMPKTNSSAMMDNSSVSGYAPFSLEKYNIAKREENTFSLSSMLHGVQLVLLKNLILKMHLPKCLKQIPKLLASKLIIVMIKLIQMKFFLQKI
jgi:hypothetical protein